MIRRVYALLPGPTAVRLGMMAVLAALAVAALLLFYEWLGVTFLDTGGRVG